MLTINLWFNTEAEEAANFYTSIFPNSSIDSISRYGKAGKEIHGFEEGKVMTVNFSLNGQKMTALNGGPVFQFNEAVSLIVHCKDQAEIDHYWDRLKEGGDPKSQVCGWLKDKYGVSWQIVPIQIEQWMTDPDAAKRNRVMAELLKMKKPELSRLESAAKG